MSKLFTRSALTAAALLLFAAGVRADDAYEIKLSRPAQVGDKFDLVQTASVDRKMKVAMDGQEVKNDTEKMQCSFEGRQTLTAVDDLGYPKEFHLVVKKLQAAAGDDKPDDVAPAGAEFDVKYDGKQATFTKKDADISDPEKKALAMLFHPRDSDKSDDEMFGTTEKKKVGDSWSPNLTLLAQDLQDAKLDPKTMSGKMKLVDEKPIGTEPALTVSGTIETADFSLGELGKAKNGKLTVEMTGQFPKNPKSQAGTLNGSMTMTGDFEMTSQGETLNVSAEMSMKSTGQTTPVK